MAKAKKQTKTTQTRVKFVQIKIRVPEEMRNSLKEAAYFNSQTLNSEVTDRLTFSFISDEFARIAEVQSKRQLAILSSIESLAFDVRQYAAENKPQKE